jgi:hypothetical protein
MTLLDLADQREAARLLAQHGRHGEVGRHPVTRLPNDLFRLPQEPVLILRR